MKNKLTMKKTLTIIGTAISISSFAQAKIKVLETLHNFDTIHFGGPVSYDYKFVNTGNEPLIISRANTSCGCDIPTWKKEPVAPGDTSFVNYKYDSKRIGPINKSMTISSNDLENPNIVVKVKGYILPKEEVIIK